MKTRLSAKLPWREALSVLIVLLVLGGLCYWYWVSNTGGSCSLDCG